MTSTIGTRCPAASPRTLSETKGKVTHTLISLLMSLAMLSVIVLSLAAGVGLGYMIIFGILYAFDRSRRMALRTPAQVLNASTGGN
jgi:hypothetical protein